MTQKRFRFLEADPNKQPPNYSSKKTQRKLLMLIGTLFLVIYAMQQAGRPESWRWLVQLDQRSKAAKAEQSESGEKSVFVRSDLQSDLTADRRNDLSEADALRLQQLEQNFWSVAVERMESAERFSLVYLIGSWADELSVDLPDNDVQTSAVRKLQQLRQLFTDQVKQRAAGATGFQPINETESEESGELPDRGFEDSQPIQVFDLTNEISLQVASAVEDQSRWLDGFLQSVPGIIPTGENGSNGPLPHEIQTLGEVVEQQQKWKKLRQSKIDPVLTSLITDGTRIGQAEERAAWLRWVQRAMSESTETAENVTRQNLMGQPDQFRGQWVTVSGTLRLLESKRQTTPEITQLIGEKDYLVAWIQPGISSQGPYCVYVLQDQNLRQLVGDPNPRRSVRVSGLFFKIFPYAVSEKTTAIGPVMIARTTQLQAVATVDPVAPPSSRQWGMLIGSVVLLASFLGIGAWLSTRYRTANPIGQRLYKSGELGWLSETKVESVGQSLQRIATESGPLSDDNPSGRDDTKQGNNEISSQEGRRES